MSPQKTHWGSKRCLDKSLIRCNMSLAFFFFFFFFQSNNNMIKLNAESLKVFILVAVAVSCVYAGYECSCTVYCSNQYDTYTVDYHNLSSCSDCSNLCNSEYYWIAYENCPGRTYYSSSYTCISDLGIGIIAAIVVGALVVVVCAPVIICFCMGAACFSYRKRTPTYTTVTSSYGTSTY
eukprot:m.220223 g.220223  ORF g.220223 m.220223 type:complete len:179 (+) comp13829_c2_seq1:2181-2717(+)